jgi:zinc/manganese transport system ATP-binding protein
VHHLSGAFETGSFTAVTGPNGAGKSTLLKCIAGLIRPQEGRVVMAGIGPRDVAYMPQADELPEDFPITLSQMVGMGCWRSAGNFKAIGKNLRQKTQEALKAVGLQDFGGRQLSTLSCGQHHRALFARALVQDARLLLLDEPFAAVDAETIEALLGIMQGWHREGRTIICVVHNLGRIRRHFPRCLLLAREGISWGETEATLTPQNLQRAKMFHEAWQPKAEPCQQ